MPFQELAFDFQSDEEEEDNHQALIDPLHQRFVDDERPKAKMDRAVVYEIVNHCKGGIGYGQSQKHRRDHQQTRCLFVFEELLNAFHFEIPIDFRNTAEQ